MEGLASYALSITASVQPAAADDAENVLSVNGSLPVNNLTKKFNQKLWSSLIRATKTYFG